jgi:hypothetical protein
MLVRRYSIEDDEFFRSLTQPFEDWLASGVPARLLKGYRWFRSVNVVPIEHYKRAPACPNPVFRKTG